MAQVVTFPHTHAREHAGVPYVIERTKNSWRWYFTLGDLIKKDMPTKIYGYGNSIIQAEENCRKRIDVLLDTYQKDNGVKHAD